MARTYPPELEAQVDAGLAAMGKVVGHLFGDEDDPLLVSVRSGARALDAGDDGHRPSTSALTGQHRRGARARRSNNERFAYDSYRRFIQMYSNVVLDVNHHEFEEILDDYKGPQGRLARHRPRRRPIGRKLIIAYKAKVEAKTGGAVPAGSTRPALGRRSARSSARG